MSTPSESLHREATRSEEIEAATRFIMAERAALPAVTWQNRPSVERKLAEMLAEINNRLDAWRIAQFFDVGGEFPMWLFTADDRGVIS